MSGTPDLTAGEELLLLTVAEPFVFRPDGLLEPLSSRRVAEMWWQATASEVTRQPEPA